MYRKSYRSVSQGHFFAVDAVNETCKSIEGVDKPNAQKLSSEVFQVQQINRVSMMLTQYLILRKNGTLRINQINIL